MSVREIFRYLSEDIIISLFLYYIIFPIKILTKLSIKHNKIRKRKILCIFSVYINNMQTTRYSMDLGPWIRSKHKPLLLRDVFNL